MIGIFLTLLAVLIVICLAFCYTDHGIDRTEHIRELALLYRGNKKKS